MTPPAYAPVTPQQAALNRAVLEHELREYATGRSDRASGWVLPEPEPPVVSCACAWDCGAPVYRRRYGRSCYRRWWRAGRPDEGPPPPMPAARRASMAAARALAAVPAPDREAAAAARRGVLMRPLARDWIRCARWGDARGLDQLAGCVTDWRALAEVLALCASPERTLIVTGHLPARVREDTHAA